MAVVHGTNATVQVSPDGGKTWVDINPCVLSLEDEVAASNSVPIPDPSTMKGPEEFSASELLEADRVRKLSDHRISRRANMRQRNPGR